MSALDRLLHEAEQLPPTDIIELAERLLARFEPDPALDQAWQAEVDRRLPAESDVDSVDWVDLKRRLVESRRSV